MATPDSRRSTVAWGVAGLPLVATLVQTLMALFGYTSESAGVEPIADPLLSVPVLFEAAVVFKQSSGVVLGLFVLIAAAWIGQGVGMYLLERREAAYGAASLSAVLFFALFFGVYAPLFGSAAGVPIWQLGVFSLIPVIASGLMVYGAASHPWERSVERRANADLGGVETTLDTAEGAFADGFDRRFPDRALDRLATLAPEAVADAKEDRREFEQTVTDIRERVAECRSLDPEARHRAVTETERRADGLAPEERLDEIETDLRERVATRLREEYGDVSVESSFGGSYRLVNLPTQYRELELPGADGPVHIDRLGETLTDIAHEAQITTLGETAERVERELGRIRSYLDREEQRTREAIETTEENLTTVERRLDDDRLTFDDRLDAILREGRTEASPGITGIRRQVEDAKRSLHDCDFESAARTAQRAADDSSTLTLVVEFAGGLSSAVAGGRESVGVPDGAPDDVVDSLASAAETAHEGVQISRTGGRLQIQQPGTADATVSEPEEPEPDTTSETSETGGGPTTSVAPAESVVDEVLYVLRELASESDADDRFFQYSLESLPDSLATPDVLVNVRRVTQRQSDLFDDVTLQSPEPPGFIEFTAADDTNVHDALETTHQRFRDQYT